MINETIIDDEKIAIQRKCIFYVSTKEGRGKPWIKICNDITKLSDAYNLAVTTEAYEVAIFNKGFMYWSSKHPVYNSSVGTLKNEFIKSLQSYFR